MFVELQARFPTNTRALCALIGHHYSSCPFKRKKTSRLLSHESGIL